MVNMAMGQPYLFDSYVGLLDRGLNFRNVPAGADHHGLFGGFAPYQRAVLLERRYRDDDSAGFCLGFGFICHVRTMPIFCGAPRARFEHFLSSKAGRRFAAMSRTADPRNSCALI